MQIRKEMEVKIQTKWAKKEMIETESEKKKKDIEMERERVCVCVRFYQFFNIQSSRRNS